MRRSARPRIKRSRELEDVSFCGVARASESPGCPPFSHLVLTRSAEPRLGDTPFHPEISLHPRPPSLTRAVLHRPYAKSHVRPHLYGRRFRFLWTDKHAIPLRISQIDRSGFGFLRMSRSVRSSRTRILAENYKNTTNLINYRILKNFYFFNKAIERYYICRKDI